MLTHGRQTSERCYGSNTPPIITFPLPVKKNDCSQGYPHKHQHTTQRGSVHNYNPHGFGLSFANGSGWLPVPQPYSLSGSVEPDCYSPPEYLHVRHTPIQSPKAVGKFSPSKILTSTEDRQSTVCKTPPTHATLSVDWQFRKTSVLLVFCSSNHDIVVV